MGGGGGVKEVGLALDMRMGLLRQPQQYARGVPQGIGERVVRSLSKGLWEGLCQVGMGACIKAAEHEGMANGFWGA